VARRSWEKRVEGRKEKGKGKGKIARSKKRAGGQNCIRREKGGSRGSTAISILAKSARRP
jgi:hypothetical protein